MATFCVLNLVVAIILNAFTWCYALEPSEITAGLDVNSEHMIHFTVIPRYKWQGIDSSLQEIWIRFDLFGTGFIELQQLQFLMSIVLYNIPELCRTGEVVENATANAHNTDSLILSGEPVR